MHFSSLPAPCQLVWQERKIAAHSTAPGLHATKNAGPESNTDRNQNHETHETHEKKPSVSRLSDAELKLYY
jgi:hypothetical protein